MARKSVVWPCAQIESVDEYLRQLEALVEASDDWILQKAPECTPRTILAKYVGQKFDGEDLSLTVFECGPPKGLVNFAPIATLWAGIPAHQTTVSDKQINSAFRLFEPLARQAAMILNTLLSITLSKPRRYKMPTKLKELVDQFVFLANLNGLHPCDWERFYDIVHYAHRYGVDMRPGDLARELSARRVLENIVSELRMLYQFGRSLLARRFTWEGR